MTISNNIFTHICDSCEKEELSPRRDLMNGWHHLIAENADGHHCSFDVCSPKCYFRIIPKILKGFLKGDEFGIIDGFEIKFIKGMLAHKK